LVYQDLIIGFDGVHLKWIGDNCSMLFEVQGYIFDHLQANNYTDPENVISGMSGTAKIPTNQLNTSTGNAIYYRLVGVYANGTICSHDGTRNTFYTFNGK
jgi:hypothetical protein